MLSTTQGGTVIKVNKTCDICRHRKIRCILPETSPSATPTCVYCAKRGDTCHFSAFRRKVRVKVQNPVIVPRQAQNGEHDLFIDRLLQDGPQEPVFVTPARVFKAPDEQVPSSSLAFFSEAKVAFLTERIGNNSLQELVEKLDDNIVSRLGLSGDSPWAPIKFQKPSQVGALSPDEAQFYIEAYFTNYHPVYPFLDRDEFEQNAYSPELTQKLAHNPAFSALYHTVLALGSQYFQGGTFKPGSGKAWELFQMSLGHMADIMLPRESLESLQALAAMSLFAMNTCCLQVDDVLITHAARMARAFRYHRNSSSETAHLRTFWVIYALEKQQSFRDHCSSLIADEDIGCPIPSIPESQFGDYNWFLSFIRLGRISSIAFTSLFCVSAALKTVETRLSAIDETNKTLEAWRQSVPPDFRPGGPKIISEPTTAAARQVALQTHFSYYTIVIALERLTLHLDREGGHRLQASRQKLMNTARNIIELTRYIDPEPHVPIQVLAIMPVSAMFILFDFIIHNPHHHESRKNLALMDSVAGYFSLLEMASNSALPGKLLPEFARIAREFYWKSQQQPEPSTQQQLSTPHVEPVTIEVEPQSEGSALEVTGLSANTNMQTENQSPMYAFPVAPEGLDLSPSFTPGSSYLNYPTPTNLEGVSDMQMADFSDFKTMFGWVFPDSSMSGINFDSFNINDQTNFNNMQP